MSGKVLIVEDESLVAMEIESALKKSDFETCAVVDDGEKAIELAKKCKPDVVLMDIYLNGHINGIEACKKIKNLYGIPVIFLTAYSDKTTMDEAIGCLPDGYLIKPFRRAELFASVEMAIKKRENIKDDIVKVCNNVYYDKKRFLIINGDKEYQLTKKEVELLELLLLNRGKIVSFEDIEYHIWPQKEVSNTTRRTLFHRLRSKISKECFKTFPGIGCIIE